MDSFRILRAFVRSGLGLLSLRERIGVRAVGSTSARLLIHALNNFKLFILLMPGYLCGCSCQNPAINQNSIGFPSIAINNDSSVDSNDWIVSVTHEEDLPYLDAIKGHQLTIEMPWGSSYISSPIYHAYLDLSLDGSSVRRLKIQEFPQSRNKCIDRVRQISSDLNIQVSGLNDWNKAIVAKNSLRRFVHRELDSVYENELTIQILPVPSVNDQWMVMTTYTWSRE